MDLWIRSQNKEILAKVDLLYIEKGKKCLDAEEGYDIVDDKYRYGRYGTLERALQILDEIQGKIKSLLYLKSNIPLGLNDIKCAKSYFEELNEVDVIICDNNFEIVPISTNIVVYEMPKGEGKDND